MHFYLFDEWLVNWAKRRMKDPVLGKFKTTGEHRAQVVSRVQVDDRTTYTGVITAPGIPATTVERKADRLGRMEWAELDHGFKIEYAVLVDRADPTRFVILWKQVRPATRETFWTSMLTDLFKRGVKDVFS